ncbi:hypothetical protein V2J09_002045 [Rumex salicifolius]
MLKIVTYNVNGLRQRVSQFGSLLKLLNSFDADIICFQEIKLTRQELTSDMAMAEGYESFFSCTRTSGKGRTGYSGVATFCRVSSAFSCTEVALPVAAEEGFTGLLEISRVSEARYTEMFANSECLADFTNDELLEIDSEGRCIITDHGHFVLFNIYGPRADPDDEERIHFKTTFYKVLQKRWELFQQQERRIIVVGDLNIAPSAIDRCEAGPDFEQNDFRKWLRSMLVMYGGTFFDVFREKHPERKDAYTCWAVHNGAEEFNYGSRIDHILASGLCLHETSEQPGHDFVTCHVEECDIMLQYRRWKPGTVPRWKAGKSIKLEGSDHVPVYAVLSKLQDCPMHNTPSLSTRYIPGIRGSQQTIVSILKKRNVSGRISINQFEGSPSQDSSLTSMPTKSVSDSEKKRKLKTNQPSQLSLKSFFQKVPRITNGIENSTKDAMQNPEEDSKLIDILKETPEPYDTTNGYEESDCCTSTCTSMVETNLPAASCPPEKDKKDSALSEWRRIQQFMQDSIPLCNGHNEPCVSRVVKKQGPNFGRRFYVCARSEGPSSNPETRCDFFRWAAFKTKRK